MIACSRLAAGQGTSLSGGIESLSRYDLPRAMRLFRLAADDTNPAIRSAAERWLAHLSWKVYADPKMTAAHIDRALTSTVDPAPVLIERARLFVLQHRYRDALRAAADAMHVASDAEGRGFAARTLADVAVTGAFVAISVKANIADSIDDASLHLALDTLRARVTRFPGRTPDALALIHAGAVVFDAGAIRQGWTSYFRLVDDSTGAALAGARRLIAAGELPKIGEALATSGLYESAALVLDQLRIRPGRTLDARQSDIVAYGTFLHDLRAGTYDFYRRALLGVARPGDLDRVLTARTHALWPLLHWSGAPPPYYPAAVPPELAKRFHTTITMESDGPIPELHVGQAIGSFAFQPKVGPGGPRRYVVLDGLASNGLIYWLLDEAAGRAGWVSGDSIFEVRTSFTELPFREWLTLTDGRTVDAERRRIERDSIGDLARARTDSAGYLPGVEARLFRDGLKPIVDSLSRAPGGLLDQEAAFIDILFRQLTETTIGLHESRHLADTRLPNRVASGADAEFRAKIDEVTGTRRPKLALTAIIHPNIGDATSHGQANRRVMLGLIRWLRANAATVAGFDPSAPPLLQLPLLSDDQLRAAFESMRQRR